MSAETDADVVGRLFEERHSCRAFSDQPVDDATIRAMLEMAQRSPSWCNTQPWEVHVTRPETTRRLAEAFVEHARVHGPQPDLAFPDDYPGVYGDRRRACGWQLYESVGVERGDRVASQREALRNFALFDAPHAAIVTTSRALGTYGAVDCGVFLGHLLVAATSLGIATVPQAALAAVSPIIRAELGLADDRAVVFGVSFGYEAVEQPANAFRTPRAALEDVVNFV